MEALNDTEKVLNSLGVTLRDSADSWRDPMEVLNEVGEMWDGLTDIDKSAIATSLGGYDIAATYGNIWVLYMI